MNKEVKVKELLSTRGGAEMEFDRGQANDVSVLNWKWRDGSEGGFGVGWKAMGELLR